MHRCAALAGIVSALALASPASADPGNGAQHISYSVCFPSPGFYQQCFEGNTLTNTTENKNNISVFAHEDVVVTFTGEAGGPFEGCSQTTQSKNKVHYLIKKESGTHVYAFKGSGLQIQVDCFGEPSQTCTFTSSYHYANGQVQYERSETACKPL